MARIFRVRRVGRERGKHRVAETERETVLRTSIGELALQEYRLQAGGRAWGVLHTEAVLSLDDETRFLDEQAGRMPYGVVLWPAAIALAHDVVERGDAGTLGGPNVAHVFASGRVRELAPGSDVSDLV